MKCRRPLMFPQMFRWRLAAGENTIQRTHRWIESALSSAHRDSLNSPVTTPTVEGNESWSRPQQWQHTWRQCVISLLHLASAYGITAMLGARGSRCCAYGQHSALLLTEREHSWWRARAARGLGSAGAIDSPVRSSRELASSHPTDPVIYQSR